MLPQIREVCNLHQTVPDDVDTITGVAFAKNLLSGGELPFLRDAAQSLPLGGTQTLKKRH